MTLEDKTLKRIDRVSKLRPVSEKEYLRAIKQALSEVQLKLNSIDGDTYTRRRAEEVYRGLKSGIDKSTQGFITGFYPDMFDVINGDTKKMEREASGYIDGFYSLDEKEIKNVLSFREIYFTTEKVDGSITNSLIGVDDLLKSVGKDTLKRVKSTIVSGAVLGVNPNKIASQIGKIKGIEARHLRTVVRTQFADAQQRVNMASLDKNKEWYDGYEYNAHLDKRTTLICRSANGKKWKAYADIPESYFPPLHPNCRSTILGIIED